MSNMDYMDKASPSSMECMGLGFLVFCYILILCSTLAKLVLACRIPESESLLRLKMFYSLISLIAALRTLWLLDFLIDFDREAYAYLNIVPNALLMLLGSIFCFFWCGLFQIKAVATVSSLSFLAKAVLPCLLFLIDLSAKGRWMAFMLIYYSLVEVIPTAYILLVLKATGRDKDAIENELISTAETASPIRFQKQDLVMLEDVPPRNEAKTALIGS